MAYNRNGFKAMWPFEHVTNMKLCNSLKNIYLLFHNTYSH